MKTKTLKAFTIIEIIIVIIIMSAIAGFAIPNYLKSVRKARVNDAKTQLTALYSAQAIYRARTGFYWPTDGLNKTTADINDALNLNLIENGSQYTCDAGADADSYTCGASIGDGTCTLVLTQDPLSDTNPSEQGSCP
jgi:prepilin-type N-terminal cleavage/methylation domain-containing protein